MRSLRTWPVALVPTVLALAHGDGASPRGVPERWQLGNGTAIEFTRTQTLHTTVTETRETPPPPRDVDLGVFRGPQIAALLLPSDLDKEQKALVVPPDDLRDLARFVALDLKRAPRSKSRATLPQVPPFGDLVLAITTDPVAADGTQRIVCDVTRVAPDPRGEPAAAFAGWVRGVLDHELTARLEITRTLDMESGVKAFTSRLEGTVTYPKENARRKATFTLEETHAQLRTWRADSPELRTAVANAIRAGSKFLQARLAKPGEGELAAGTEREGTATYSSGRLALGLLTVLKAEGDPKLPAVVAALTELRRRVLADTYSLACAIMAIEALYAPIGERDDLLSGRITRPYPRKPSAEDRVLLAGYVEQLMENRDPRFDKTARLAWGYGSGQRQDASNSQYAALGLWSASLCGIEIPASTWAAAANHWLQEQRTTKELPIEVRVVTHAQKEAAKAPGASPTVAVRRVEPFGWPYIAAEGRPAYASMTCAGITALSLCCAALAQGKTRGEHAALVQRAEHAISQGFAWLGSHFTERYNSGYPPAPQQWHHYSLYALERACEFSQVALLQDRDWYFEGAVQLCAGQLESGEMGGGGFEGTCFGVLFLKKAALPTLTPRR